MSPPLDSFLHTSSLLGRDLPVLSLLTWVNKLGQVALKAEAGPGAPPVL